jgi:hypothetical protein
MKYLSSIEPLNGTDYPKWLNQVQVAIAVCEYDLALREDKPAEPTGANVNHTSIEKWKRC